MELQPEKAASGPVITGFSGRVFRVGERVYPGGLLIAPEGTADWDAPAELGLLSATDVAPLLDRDPLPEFLLLGTGDRLVRPAAAFVSALEARGIGVEVMDSRAAARAWGVLRQEGRDIVGALMPL